MFKKLLFIPLLIFPVSVFSQSVDIAVGTSNSDTTEVCNGASINVSATTSGITSITGYSWQISNALQLINIACPKPYFYYEKKFLFFRLGSYFAMEKIDGMDIVSYQESIKKSSDTKVLKEKILKLFGKFIYFKFIHGDFKKTNILVDNKMQISIIDFDKSFFSMSQSIYNYKIKNQIARFLSNWKNKSKFLTAIRSLEKII